MPATTSSTILVLHDVNASKGAAFCQPRMPPTGHVVFNYTWNHIQRHCAADAHPVPVLLYPSIPDSFAASHCIIIFIGLITCWHICSLLPCLLYQQRTMTFAVFIFYCNPHGRKRSHPVSRHPIHSITCASHECRISIFEPRLLTAHDKLCDQPKRD